eukprot:jgi/Chrzof1/9426/Cz04g02190.t1
MQHKPPCLQECGASAWSDNRLSADDIGSTTATHQQSISQKTHSRQLAFHLDSSVDVPNTGMRPKAPPCRHCNAAGRVLCKACEGAGTLTRGGFHKKNTVIMSRVLGESCH